MTGVPSHIGFEPDVIPTVTAGVTGLVIDMFTVFEFTDAGLAQFAVDAMVQYT